MTKQSTQENTQDIRKLHFALKILACVMIASVIGVQLYCANKVIPDNQTFIYVAESWIYGTFFVSLAYFFLFVVFMFFVFPDGFISGATPRGSAMRVGVFFGIFSAAITIFILVLKFSPDTLDFLVKPSTPVSYVIAATSVAFMLITFDWVILGKFTRVQTHETWNNFMVGARRLDTVVILSLVSLFFYCLFIEHVYLHQYDKELNLFVAGGTALLMTVSTGIFSLEVLLSKMGEP